MLANCLEHVKWKIANTNGEVKVNTTSEAAQLRRAMDSPSSRIEVHCCGIHSPAIGRIACPTPCSRQDIRCEGTQVASRDSLHYSGPDMPCLRMNKKWESIKIAVS